MPSCFLLVATLLFPFCLCSQYDFYHSFHSVQGCNGKGQLVLNEDDGMLYGWTTAGGEHGDGVGFKFTKDLNIVETIINYKKDKTGYSPQHGTYIINDAGIIGTSSAGVNEGVWGGTIHSVTTVSSNDNEREKDYKTLYQFSQTLSGSGVNGTTVMNGLTSAPNGRLYGVTTNGGQFWDSCSSQGFGGGVFFSLSFEGGDFNYMTSFGRPLDGSDNKCDCFASSGAPTFGENGTIAYLLFRYGGEDSLGGLMAVNIWTNEVKSLFYFNSSTGHTPLNPTLLFSNNNTLFGTTSQGGAGSFLLSFSLFLTHFLSGDGGTLFSIHEDGSDFTVLHTFCKEAECLDGTKPYDGVIEGDDGMLYGMTYGGGEEGWGVLYRIGKDGENFEVLREFDEKEGGKPMGLLTSADGVLYGVLQEGGLYGCGAVFGINYPISSYEETDTETAVIVVSVLGGLFMFVMLVTVCVRFERQRFAFIV